MMNYTLITGACGGLGRAFVEACAKNKENLVLTGTNQKKLDSLVLECAEIFKGIKVETFVCDLGKKSDIDALDEGLSKKDITISKLINNAGVIIEGDILKFKDEELVNAVRVNCEGTVDLTQKIIKIRDKSQELNIITVASMAGYYPMPYMAIYASTKAMLKNLMIAMHYELMGQGVNITTICPSGIPTSEAMKEAIKSQGLAGKITQSLPEQIAKMAIKANKKKKVVVVPKCINKIILAISNICGDKMLAKTTRRMWKKSYEKRQREGKL